MFVNWVQFGSRLACGRWLFGFMVWLLPLFPWEFSQQSIWQSTRLSSTKTMLGANTLFSAKLCKCLAFSALRFMAARCSLLVLHYPLPLGMYRTSKDGLSWCDSWPFEARKMPNRNTKDAFRQADVSFLSLQWRKNGDFARWVGQNLNTTF